MSNDTLTVTDNRTGKTYEIPIENDTIPAIALRQIKVNDDDFGMMTYDPGYSNTAPVKSEVTFIDGDKGILRYRGYPIEQLAENSTFLEVAYLLIYGELPTKEEFARWEYDILHRTFVHENLAAALEAFRYDAHPMSMLISGLSIMSTMYPEARNVTDPVMQDRQILRILGQLPTVAAFAYRHRIGRPYNYPEQLAQLHRQLPLHAGLHETVRPTTWTPS